MRIGLDLFSFIPGKNFGVGPTNYAYGLVEHLISINRQHAFVLFTHSKNCDYFKGLKNCKIITSRLRASKGVNRIIHEQFMLPYYQRKEKLDLLHLTGNVVPLCVGGNSVLTVHDQMWKYYFDSKWIPLYKKIYYGSLCPVSFRRAKTIIVMSEYIKDELKKCYRLDEKKIFVIPLAPCLRPRPLSPPDEQALQQRYGQGYVFSVTTTWPHKNLITLLKAYAFLRQKCPGFNQRLIVAGQNWLRNREIDRFIKEHGWGDEHFLSLGFVPESTLNYLYQHAGIFVFPSLYEGFGIPPLEAMKAGVPVVAARAASLPEVCGDACLYADPRSPEDFAEQMARIITDENLRSSLVAKGRDHEQKFLWDKTARRTMDLYETRVATFQALRHPMAAAPQRPLAGADAIEGRRRPKKILIIHNYYLYAGGEDHVVSSESDLLKQYGHDVVLYTRSNKEVYLSPDLRKLQFSFMEMPWSKKTYADLNRLIAREKPDIAHVHNPFFMMTPSAYQACFDNGVPVVQTFHNYRFLCANGVLFRNGQVCERCLYGGNHQAVLSKCLHGSYARSFMQALVIRAYQKRRILQKMVDGFIAPSHFCRDLYARHAGLPAERVFIKPHFIYDPGISEGQKEYALYVGTIREYKGIQVLLKAWEQMKDIPLKIAGEIPSEKQWLKAHLPSDKNVEFLGGLTMPEVLGVMKKAKCIIVPSICYETFGRAVIEAYACGVPVVASNIGALKERVIDGQTGFLFRPGDAEDLREKTRRIIDDPVLTNQLGRNARALYEQQYTADANYRRLIEIYNKVMITTGQTTGTVFDEEA